MGSSNRHDEKIAEGVRGSNKSPGAIGTVQKSNGATEGKEPPSSFFSRVQFFDSGGKKGHGDKQGTRCET